MEDVDTRESAPSLRYMIHSPGFLKLVDDARSRVSEITIANARERLAANREAVLVDVREDSEWASGHAAEAVHLGKGILEDVLGQRPIADPALQVPQKRAMVLQQYLEWCQ